MTTVAPNPRGARRAMVTWASVIIGLLALQITLCGLGIYLAHAGKTFAVEHDYYDQAVHWDEQKARTQALERAGWKTQLSVAEIASADGQRGVTITLLDKDGVQIRDARMALEAFHHARGRNVLTAKLAPNDLGLYATRLPLSRPGTWEFRLTITRGGATYAERIVRAIKPAAYVEGPR